MFYPASQTPANASHIRQQHGSQSLVNVALQMGLLERSFDPSHTPVLCARPLKVFDSSLVSAGEISLRSFTSFSLSLTLREEGKGRSG